MFLRFLIVFVSCFPLLANCQVKLASLFSDNMVFQRDQPVTIWGTAPAGSIITVQLDQEIKSSVTDSAQRWLVKLSPRAASVQPTEIYIADGIQQVSIHGILFGDVWLCIGQSNMEWPLSRDKYAKDELQVANIPLLRFYNPGFIGKNYFATAFSDSMYKLMEPATFYRPTTWTSADSITAKQMTAVGYYFGKYLTQELGVPIGLFNYSIGGAPLESFIDTQALLSHFQFNKKVKGNWLQNNELPVWVRERGMQNVGVFQSIDTHQNGVNHAFKPGFVYEAAIACLHQFPIRGILCYQGESNAQELSRVEEYKDLSTVLVEDYRNKWKQPQLPFYFVQLSSIDSVRYRSQLWPLFRDQQRILATSLPYAGMVVSSDVGALHDVHPTDKRIVGMRLSQLALEKTYGKLNLSANPQPLKAKYFRRKVVVFFSNTGGSLKTKQGERLLGFAIGEDSTLMAKIEGDKVIIPVKRKPAFITYGWRPYSNGNLYNATDFPLSTFKITVD